MLTSERYVGAERVHSGRGVISAFATEDAVTNSPSVSAEANGDGNNVAVSDQDSETLSAPIAEDKEGLEAQMSRDQVTPEVSSAASRAPASPVAVTATISDLKIQTLAESDAQSMYISDTFYLAMNWDASGNGANLHQGDYFDITLPSNMKFPANTTATDFDLYAPDGLTVIAKAHVTPGPDDVGGIVRITFTDYVEGKENIRGSLRLASRFDETQVTYPEINTFNVSVSGVVVPVSIQVTGPSVIPDGEIISKWSGKVESNSNQARWSLRINHGKATLTNVVLKDQLSEGAGTETYVPGTFQLRRVEMDSTGVVLQVYETIDVTDKLTIAPDRRSFELRLGDINGEQYRLSYNSTYTPGTTLRNNAELTSTEQNKTTSVTYIGASSGGSGAGNLANKIKLIKVDKDDETITIPGAVFEVTAPDGSTFDLTTGSDGTVVSGFLTSGTYKVKEKTPPAGYLPNEEEFTLNVTASGGVIQTIKDERIKINISVEKNWVGPVGNSIIVKLFADGVDTGKTITLQESNDWKDSFEGLPKFNNQGTEIEYMVEETGVDTDRYDSVISGDMASGFIITNTNKETVNIRGSKTWEDDNNRDGKRPSSIVIKLLKDNVEEQSKTVTEADGWVWSFDNMPKFDPNDGHEFNYTVSEEAVSDYSSIVNGFDIVNSYTPGKTFVTVTKIWNDTNDKDSMRPDSVKVQLYANGKPVDDPVVLDAAGKWTYTWNELFQKQDGEDIVYSVEEVNVPKGYVAKVAGDAQQGFTIENTHEPSKEQPSKKTEKSKSSKITQTGDGMSALVLGGLAIAGAVALGVAFYVRKRN